MFTIHEVTSISDVTALIQYGHKSVQPLLHVIAIYVPETNGTVKLHMYAI